MTDTQQDASTDTRIGHQSRISGMVTRAQNVVLGALKDRPRGGMRELLGVTRIKEGDGPDQ